jgi:hypothetical protein
MIVSISVETSFLWQAEIAARVSVVGENEVK